MSAIWNSIQAMPHSSMWGPIALSGLWSLIMVWPRADGGGVGYSLGAVAPAWFTMGPLAVAWAVWAIIVAMAA